jgi:hypothetical protein
MAELVKDFFWGMPIGLYIILFLSIGLGIAGFCVPPLGAISGSLLKFIALILGSTWLFYVTANIPRFIERGAKIKASYGDATIEIGRKNKEEKEGTDGSETKEGQE